MWEFESKSWKKRCEDLKIGTPEAVSSLGRHQNEGGGDARTRVRAAPSLEPWDVIRAHVILTIMGIMKLPARAYYWSKNVFVGNRAIQDIMSQVTFEPGTAPGFR